MSAPRGWERAQGRIKIKYIFTAVLQPTAEIYARLGVSCRNIRETGPIFLPSWQESFSLQEELHSPDSVHAPNNLSLQAQKLKLCHLRQSTALSNHTAGYLHPFTNSYCILTSGRRQKRSPSGGSITHVIGVRIKQIAFHCWCLIGVLVSQDKTLEQVVPQSALHKRSVIQAKACTVSPTVFNSNRTITSLSSNQLRTEVTLHQENVLVHVEHEDRVG